MAERPLVLPVSSRVNLDEVFGHVCENVIREPVCPYKMVVCELITTYCELDPTEAKFSHNEATMLHSMIYGLTQHEPMPFQDVLRCVRHYDSTVSKQANIYNHFMKRIEEIESDGQMMRFNFAGLVDDKKLDDRNTHRNLIYKSPVSLWALKVCVHGNSLTHEEQFKLHKQLLEYIQGDKYSFKKPRKMLNTKVEQKVPFEIENSTKARKWIERQMHLLQVCPSAALDEDQLFKWCDIIKSKHKDVAQVHFLEMVQHVRNRNPYKSQEALRQYFDYSVFRPNSGDLVFSNSQVKRIGMTDQRAFRYGPLLAARIHRLFGDRQMARSLLRECMREAHSNLDKTCMILVMVELAALDGMSLSRAAREQARAERIPNDGEPPITCHDVLRLMEKESTGEKQVEFRDQGDEDAHIFQSQLADASQFCSAIIAAKNGSFLRISDLIKDPLHSTSADDLQAKSRLIYDAATALLTGLRLIQGYVDSSRSTATAMVECNTSDGIAPHHETEAHAIAHVNIIYGHAFQGRWEEALQLIAKLEERFPQEKYWQCSQHVLLAKSLLYFDNAFRMAKWKECEEYLRHIEAFSNEEFTLRSCLYLAQRGKIQSAVQKLTSEIQFAEKESSFIYQARLKMQLELIQQKVAKVDPDRSSLKAIHTQALQSGLDMIAAMVTRRIGVLYLLNDRLDEAQLMFSTCEKALNNVGSPLELTLLYMGWTRAKIQARQEPREVMASARKFAVIAGHPILEKVIMQWVAVWYDDKVRIVSFCLVWGSPGGTYAFSAKRRQFAGTIYLAL